MPSVIKTGELDYMFHISVLYNMMGKFLRQVCGKKLNETRPGNIK